MFGNNYSNMGGYGFNNSMGYGRMMGIPRNINYGYTGNFAKGGFGNGLASIFGGIKKINWANMLNNTQKTLNIVNQAIPLYNQVKPMYNNMKTMFRVFNAVKGDNNTNNEKVTKEKKENDYQNGPRFFL